MTKPLHSWALSPAEAIGVQDELRSRLVMSWDGRPVASIAGVDVSVTEASARAAIVVLGFPELAPLDSAVAEAPLAFPYIPGLLAFREGPAVLAAWNTLRHKPDLVMFDGQGIAHPRGMGIAAHLALWIDRPSIGVAKSRLYGRHDEPGPERGDWAPLSDPKHPSRVIGAVVRSKAGVKPLYVSPGHLIDVATSVEFVMACVARHRLPETTRWAHRVAGGERLPGTGGGEQPRLL